MMHLTWKLKRRLVRIIIVVSVSLLCIKTLLFFLYSSPSSILSGVQVVEHQHGGIGGSYYGIEDLLTNSHHRPHNDDINGDDLMAAHRRHHQQPSNNMKCTMSTCFNISLCLRDFKVFVYPPEHNDHPSPMYKKFLSAIRQSSYYTNKAELACVFILNLDTLDRDTLSNEFVKQLSQKIKSLRHWNHGQNHLIFNFFSGSYPDYSEELDLPYGQAMLAKASFSAKSYRNGFDISLPLLSKKHRDKGKDAGMLTKHRNLYPLHRRYLLTFKGKRYLWGHGSETRNSLHHLHNGKDIIMLTTCKHGKHWDQFVDRHCTKDNELYEGYNFSEMIANSTFCLVPRGRRLGSFRFLESLQAGCIPVSLSNGFVLPFEEVIDWTKAALNFDERQLFQLPHLLRNFPDEEIFHKRIHSQLLWEEYFSSVEKVVMATLEIIKSRIYRTHSKFTWNRYPGALAITSSYSHDLTDYPFYQLTAPQNYTAVIIASHPAPKGDSPLVLLIKKICNAPHLTKVVVLWTSHMVPKVMIPTQCSAPVIVISEEVNKQILVGMMDVVSTEAILMLWEDTDLISDEAEFGFQTWLSFPDRLVGFRPYRHYWDPMDKRWKISFTLNNQYSLVSISAAFIHRYYFHYLIHNSNSMLLKIADTSRSCLDVTLNFIISDITHKPPIKLTHRTKLTVPTPPTRGITPPPPPSIKGTTPFTLTTSKSISKTYSSCLHTLFNAYGLLPLYYSMSRADPVLFNDDVSMLRKEFRKIENRM